MVSSRCVSLEGAQSSQCGTILGDEKSGAAGAPDGPARHAEESREPAHTVPLSSDAEEEEQASSQPERRRTYLLVVHRDQIVTIPLVPGKAIVIGREEPADVTFPDNRGLSRRHARFTLLSEDGVTVEDLKSTNGTRVGGKRIERVTLRPGEEVLLAKIAVSLHVVAHNGSRPPSPESHDAFRASVEAEIARTRPRAGRSLAVLIVRTLDRRGELGMAWYSRVQAHVRTADRVGLYAPGILEALLVETTHEEAFAVAREITSQGKGDVALGCGIACYPGAASTDELIQTSLDAARHATVAQPIQTAAREGHCMLAGRGTGGDGGPVLESPAMREVERTVARLARSTASVLIHGEMGTGKEEIARLIHAAGPRSKGPLVSVNCGAIAQSLLAGELFGHEKGVFTGATQQHKGIFEAADGGTILLDEVGELSAEAQAALLRVLDHKHVRRVGGAHEIKVNVRVIAATNRDLSALAEAGKFREDLLYRLNTVEVTLPPLRQRKPDIAPLAARFLRISARENGRAVRAIAPEVMELLHRYRWPGNVRELRNVIERAVVLCEGEIIQPQDLPPRVRGPSGSEPSPATPRNVGTLDERMERFERETLLQALGEANDNQSLAARLLGLSRRTLANKLRRFGIRRFLEHRSGDAGE